MESATLTDLEALYTEVKLVDEEIGRLAADLSTAESAALGEDDDDGNEIRPGNSDDAAPYEEARLRADEAQFAVRRILGLIEGLEGARRLRRDAE